MAVTPRLVETDEIISLIYQGPLEERPWASFLRCLRERMDCEVAALSLRVRKGGSSQLNVFSRRDSASDAELSVRYKTLDGQRDPLGDKLRAPGDIYTLDDGNQGSNNDGLQNAQWEVADNFTPGVGNVPNGRLELGGTSSEIEVRWDTDYSLVRGRNCGLYER